MAIEISKKKIASSFIWTLLEKIGSQGLQFVISIYLARILLPEDYGIVALIQIFIQIANVFVIDGFSTALIQKKESDELDFSSVFWMQSIISILLYILLFVSAPFIAVFYEQETLTKVIRIFALSFFYTPLHSCQFAYVSKHMLFKVYLIPSLLCLLISGVLAIFMAKNNLGVYSLVFQQLSYGTLHIFILLFFVRWLPKFQFSFSRVKTLFSFGWKFVATGLLENLFRNIYSLIIGKAYKIDQLSYYNKGQQFPKLIAENFTNALRNVLFPSFSSKNDNTGEVKNMLRRSCQVNTFLLLPLIFGMAAVSEPMVLVLLTEKWEKAIPFLQLCCIYYAFYNINSTNMSAINALGKSDVYLKYEIIKKIVTITLLCISIPLGVFWMVIGQVITGIISSILNMIPSKKYLNYSYSEQIKDFSGAFLSALIMSFAVYFLSQINCSVFNNNLILLIIQIIFGALIYLVLSVLFKIPGYCYIIEILKKQKRSKN